MNLVLYDKNSKLVIEIIPNIKDFEVISSQHICWGGGALEGLKTGYFTTENNYSVGDAITNNEIMPSLKDQKFKSLSQDCQRAILGYFKSTVNAIDYEFSFDAEAQSNFNGYANLFNKGLVTQAEWTAWKDEETVRITLIETQFWSVAMDAFAHKDNKISRLRDVLQPQIELAQTPEDLDLIHW